MALDPDHDATEPLLVAADLAAPGFGPVSLTIAAGKIACLAGPSGIGKTRLLRLIADLDPGEGNVTLGASDRRSMTGPAWRRQVVYVPAEAGWWGNSAAEHMSREGAVSFLAGFGLEPAVLDRQITLLSTGERQRLALIRALLVGPRVLLLDEPTAALDPVSRERVEAMLLAQTAKGLAILWVTHDEAQPTRLRARRIALTSHGLREA